MYASSHPKRCSKQSASRAPYRTLNFLHQYYIYKTGQISVRLIGLFCCFWAFFEHEGYPANPRKGVVVALARRRPQSIHP